MDLKEYCTSLKKDRLLELATKLCHKAYPIWEEYCKTGSLSYRETAVGMLYTVEENLLADTLNLFDHLQIDSNSFKSQQDALLEKFIEPITAIQDGDWILPYPVEKVFYAIYNLLNGLKRPKNEFGELTHYLSVNQAVDAIYKAALMGVDEIKKLIYGDSITK